MISDQCTVLSEVGFTGWCECAADAILGKDIADLVKFFRCTV